MRDERDNLFEKYANSLEEESGKRVTVFNRHLEKVCAKPEGGFYRYNYVIEYELEDEEIARFAQLEDVDSASITSGKYLKWDGSQVEGVTLETELNEVYLRLDCSNSSLTSPLRIAGSDASDAGLVIQRNASDTESFNTYLTDNNLYQKYTNDEYFSTWVLWLENTDTESGGGARAQTNSLRIFSSKSLASLTMRNEYGGTANFYLGDETYPWTNIHGTTIYEGGVRLQDKYLKLDGTNDPMTGLLSFINGASVYVYQTDSSSAYTALQYTGIYANRSSIYMRNYYHGGSILLLQEGPSGESGAHIQCYYDHTRFYNLTIRALEKHNHQIGKLQWGESAIYPSSHRAINLGVADINEFDNVYGTTIYEDGTSLANKYAAIAHVSDTSNPHGVTATQIGALTQASADSRYLPLTGGTIVGALTVGNIYPFNTAIDSVGSESRPFKDGWFNSAVYESGASLSTRYKRRYIGAFTGTWASHSGLMKEIATISGWSNDTLAVDVVATSVGAGGRLVERMYVSIANGYNAWSVQDGYDETPVNPFLMFDYEPSTNTLRIYIRYNSVWTTNQDFAFEVTPRCENVTVALPSSSWGTYSALAPKQETKYGSIYNLTSYDEVWATDLREDGTYLSNKYVLQTTTINGHTLSGNVVLSSSDIGALTQTDGDARYLQLTGGAVTGFTRFYNSNLELYTNSSSIAPVLSIWGRWSSGYKMLIQPSATDREWECTVGTSGIFKYAFRNILTGGMLLQVDGDLTVKDTISWQNPDTSAGGSGSERLYWDASANCVKWG